MTDIINFATLPSFKKLGRDVSEAITVKQAIQISCLDYEVGLGEVYVKLDKETVQLVETEASQIPHTFATYRKDTGEAFAAVGRRYEVIQNTEVFKFFDLFIKEGKAVFEQAGMLSNGATIFISAKLSINVKIEGMPNEIIETFILLINSHDGSTSAQLILTPMRITCWNMLPGIGLNSNGRIVIRHTLSAHDKIEEAMLIMKTVDDFVGKTSELYSKLASIEVNDAEVRDLYNQIFLTVEEYELIKDFSTYRNSTEIPVRKRNLLDDINRAYVIGFGQDDIIGTMYGAVNGIIHYYQNMKHYRDEEQKMNNIFLGGTDSKIISKAVSLALLYKENKKLKEDANNKSS